MWCYPRDLFLSTVDLSMCVCMRQDKRQIPLGLSRHSSIFIQSDRVKHAGKCAYEINARNQCAGESQGLSNFPPKCSFFVLRQGNMAIIAGEVRSSLFFPFYRLLVAYMNGF